MSIISEMVHQYALRRNESHLIKEDSKGNSLACEFTERTGCAEGGGCPTQTPTGEGKGGAMIYFW